MIRDRDKGQFRLIADFKPQGDQPDAIEQLSRGLERRRRHQVLLGVTGSGKTFTMANVIARANRPTLVIAPNKTLAAQLYNEFRELFPDNAVRYFVSYYDYYQPEAYVPSTDTYIEKDASINDEIDKLRHSATKALLERSDTLIVASVSCIYGLGSPEAYFEMMVYLEEQMTINRDQMLRKLVDIQYQRSDYDFHRGTFRVRGDIVEVFPAYEDRSALRIEFFDETIEAISEIDAIRGKALRRVDKATISPASHYVTGKERMKQAVAGIRDELRERLNELRDQRKLLEAQRLEQRTLYDLELLEEMGFCPGIENYSRHLTGRKPGEPPPTLLSYFADDFLLVIDESHVTVPQVGGMYRGDRSRKETLVEYGFRLPSALDNRALNFDDIETLERVEIVRQLGMGVFDVLVGINLLREGLDLPEVSLVAILDADKEGFLRGERALIQTIGRAARNVGGRVIMYADKETDAMRAALGETNRRREIQVAYNERNDIEPRTIRKGVSDILIAAEAKGLYRTDKKAAREAPRDPEELRTLIAELEAEMLAAAEELKFEYAAKLRDEIKDLERQLQEVPS